jgi:hypothetical protein
MSRFLFAFVASASLFLYAQSAVAQADLVATHRIYPSVKSASRAAKPATAVSIVPTIETDAANRHVVTLPLELASESGRYQIEVYNEDAHLVTSQGGVRAVTIDENTFQLPAPPLRTGSYSVRVFNDRFVEIHSQKLVYQGF